MSFYNSLPQETLADLLRAYDSYIDSAVTAGLFQSGWKPACVEDFYHSEYQEIWDPQKGDESFDYMFSRKDEPDVLEFGTDSQEFYAFNGARIFKEEGGLMCQFPDEDKKRIVRSSIQDIKDGDAFIIGTGIHYADGDAHQNFDEPDSPWIVYDAGGDCWFEEDIAKPENAILSVLYGKSQLPNLDFTPVNMVALVREVPSEQERWSDAFWVDARKVPTTDLFRAAVQEYLETEEGRMAIQETRDDFNWGDAILYVPEQIWNKHGIYPATHEKLPEMMGLAPTADHTILTLTVDQDEVLIPSTYFQQSAHGISVQSGSLCFVLPHLESTPAASVHEDIFIFDEDLCVDSEDNYTCIHGYLMATTALVARARDAVRGVLPQSAIDSIENINFYPAYEVAPGSIEIMSAFDYYDAASGKEAFHRVGIPLAEEERCALMYLMEQYCLEQNGTNCLDILNEVRAENHLPALEYGKGPDSPTRENKDEKIPLSDQIQKAASKSEQAASQAKERDPDINQSR